MNHSKLESIIFLSLFFFSLNFVFGQRNVNQLSTDRFEIELTKNKDAPITILQVTDLHLGSTDEGKWRKDLITFQRIKKLVEMHDPDMIAITGDLFTGEKPFGSMLAIYIVNFFDSLKRPWIYTFGNHDPEGGFGRADIAKVFSVSEWAILGKHSVDNEWKEKYDYVVDIIVNDEKQPAWQVYAFDSGSKKGFKSIKEDQLDWYREVSKKTEKKYKEQIRAITMFHIPLIQYQYLQDDKSIKLNGKNEEKVYYEEDDGSVYNAFLKVGNIEAVFCGHDHYNNYWAKYKGGITLAYGYISGEATKYAWPIGGKLITLPTDGSEIKMENVVPVFEKNEHRY